MWSPNIQDLSVALAQQVGESVEPQEEAVRRIVERASYVEGCLADALRSGNEVMVQVERYLWTRPDDPAFSESPPVTDAVDWMEVEFEGYILGRWVRREHWSWEGVRARTIVFRREDVWDVSDERLLAIANEVLAATQGANGAVSIGPRWTIKRSLTMTYVNWDFQAR